MKISNELLAAYAEGNVSTEEKNVVRQYLAESTRVGICNDDDG